jgi:hypothetical protein
MPAQPADRAVVVLDVTRDPDRARPRALQLLERAQELEVGHPRRTGGLGEPGVALEHVRHRVVGVGRHVDLHGEARRQRFDRRRPAGRARDRTGRALGEQLPAHVGRQVLGAHAPGGLLDLDVLDVVADHGPRLGDRRVVARQEHDRDPAGGEQVGGELDLADRPSVEADVQERAQERVAEDPVGCPRLGVEADEQHRVDVVGEALELHQAGGAGLQRRPRVDVGGAQVELQRVAVGHHDLVGAAAEGAVDDGVDVVGHGAAEHVVAGQPERHVVDALHAADALHVRGDEHLHRPLLRLHASTPTANRMIAPKMICW